MFLGHRSWEQLLCGEFDGGNCPREGLFKGNCMGGKSPEMSKCPGGDFIGENCLGLVVKEELFKGNCPGGMSWRAIIRGAVGERAEIINHNAVFFNNYMSYLPPFPISVRQ